MGIKNLQEIVDEKKAKHQPIAQARPPAAIEKENCQVRSNKEDVNTWFSSEDQKTFLELPFFKKYSQKSFEPSILKKEATPYTLSSSMESISDICAENWRIYMCEKGYNWRQKKIKVLIFELTIKYIDMQANGSRASTANALISNFYVVTSKK